MADEPPTPAQPQGAVPLDALLKASPSSLGVPSKEVVAKPKKPRNKPTREERTRTKEALRGLKLTNDKTQTDIDEQKHRIVTSRSDNYNIWLLRMLLSLAGLIIVVAWECCILRLVWSQGEGKINLDPTVLLALVTTTTVNVFGLLVIVMKFVFSEVPEKSSGNKPNG